LRDAYLGFEVDEGAVNEVRKRLGWRVSDTPFQFTARDTKTVRFPSRYLYQIDPKIPEKLFKNERTVSTKITIKNNKLREKVEAVVLWKITKH